MARSRVWTRACSTAPSAEVEELADRICALRLMEVKDLNALLKERLDIPDFSMGAMPMAMPAAGGDGGDGEPEVATEEVKTKFNVKLVEFDKIIKIKLIKEIRAITNLGLKEAKDIVDKAPCDLVTEVSKDEADAIAAKLKEIGAVVALE